MPVLRIDRFFSSQGFCSRRAFKDFLKKNFVEVNSRRAVQPDEKVDTDADEIKLNGKVLNYACYTYLMMNKPAGCISAASDPKRERTVIDLLDEPYRSRALFPVGRLDKDTEGLVILTNDGTFAHNTLSPKKHVPKLYYAELAKKSTDEDARAFLNGIEIDGGYVCKPAILTRLEKPEQVTLEISEGKFHQVKRMFEARLNKVLYLKRLSFGGIKLDESLKPGGYRELNEAEMGIIHNFGWSRG